MRPVKRPTATVARRLLVAAAVLLAVSGCVRLPDDGPVVEAGLGNGPVDHPAGAHDPVPPDTGASRQTIVSGFLDAMTGWPNQINVAKQYLTTEAAEAWNPGAATIVYADTLPAQELGGEVSVELTDADRLDANRAWRGSLSPAELTLDFHLEFEDGEFRIADPPDALLVPASWFQQRFRQVALYFFDPTAQILVPEPVFVPEGEQLATSLVGALLNGPSARLSRVVRTFFPDGLDAGLSVPVSADGVADVALAGEVAMPSVEAAEPMLAQLAWTLRQDPDVSAVRLSIGGEPVPLRGGASVFDIDDADAYDPAGATTSTALYGLRRGRVVYGAPGVMNPVGGPFGTGRHDLGDIAVALGGDWIAGVSTDGTSAVVAPTTATGPRIRAVLDGTDLARPAWDHLERLWLLDRGGGEATVHVLDRGRARQIEVPGVTGQAARRLLVSPDGTRLVAVVRQDGVDRVVIARILTGPEGRAEDVVQSTVAETVGGTPQITDIAWTGPATIAVLARASGRLFEVDTVVADGASVGSDALSTIVSGRVVGLAASADEDLPPYAVTLDSVIDLEEQTETALGAPMDAVEYAG
ncbi:hypothetical protein HNR19_003027 [Nocardioides thalensis]|uniref:GerMN domain-containing protein n=1 Tax=Nocardioides thalensis TaxID=1914755 RepID=A0A853C4X6_9ACTN|nr:GerMN domain-containing protein [Nocardioides thalensis]NYJ02329.1 hypothetical protein [Nocardioides thalensis]